MGAVFLFGGPYAVAKFMTSPAGFKYMTTGVQKSPLIRDIISNAIKSAAIAGTHANIDINRKGNVPTETRKILPPGFGLGTTTLEPPTGLSGRVEKPLQPTPNFSLAEE
jgi:hypothetical protein